MRRLVADLWDLSCIAVPLVAIVGVPGAAVAAAMGWWSVAVALAVLAAGAVVAIVLPRRRRPAPVAATGVRIVAANLWNKNPVMAQAARDLVALRPDVLIVSELGQAAHEVLVEAFAHHEVLSIGGSEDGLSTPQKIADASSLLPATATFVQVEGLNHAGFGNYGVQSGDGVATITSAEARDEITAALVGFFDAPR